MLITGEDAIDISCSATCSSAEVISFRLFADRLEIARFREGEEIKILRSQRDRD